MSYIRASTKVPGQRMVSRTYAWTDMEGGVCMTSRDAMDDTGESNPPMIRMTHAEAYYFAKSLLQHVRFQKRKGETVARMLARLDRGFYAKWDREAEERSKKWLAEIGKARKRKYKKRRARKPRVVAATSGGYDIGRWSEELQQWVYD